MECPKCGYWMGPFDQECPRCKRSDGRPQTTPAAAPGPAPTLPGPHRRAWWRSQPRWVLYLLAALVVSLGLGFLCFRLRPAPAELMAFVSPEVLRQAEEKREAMLRTFAEAQFPYDKDLWPPLTAASGHALIPLQIVFRNMSDKYYPFLGWFGSHVEDDRRIKDMAGPSSLLRPGWVGFYVKDDRGESHGAAAAQFDLELWSESPSPFDVELPPGGKVEGTMLFEVPQGRRLRWLVFVDPVHRWKARCRLD